MAEMTTTNRGTPVKHMWDCPRPDLTRPAASFPILANAEHREIYHATEEAGRYNHHPALTWHEARFVAMWSDQPDGEDGPGQRIYWSTSPDAATWTHWQELFPSPVPVQERTTIGIAFTAIKFLATQGRLFAIAGLHKNIGWENIARTERQEHRDADHRHRARHGYSPVAREIGPDGGLGPIFALWDNLPEPGELQVEVLRPDDPAIAQTARGVAEEYSQPANMPPWNFDDALNEPGSVDPIHPCEPTVYPTPDGNLVMLLRDDSYSHRLYVSISTDDGQTWPDAVPTDIPDSPSKSTTLALDDGTTLLIGNQVAPDFDNADEAKHYKRNPLTVAVSRDGYLFTEVYALRAGSPAPRIEGIPDSEPGYAYPTAIVHEDKLYVIYSASKRDIWVSCVALSEIVSP